MHDHVIQDDVVRELEEEHLPVPDEFLRAH